MNTAALASRVAVSQGGHAPPAPFGYLPDFSGHWLCTSVAGNWDAFLTMNNVPPWKIKLARGTDYGAGLSLQSIEMPRTLEAITISTRRKHEGRLTRPPASPVFSDYFKLSGRFL